MAEYLSARRYYLNKRSAACIRGDDAMASLWQSKQESEPGTPLPDDFPSLDELAVAGYTTKEDLVGADSQELISYVRLSRNDAERVIAAYAAL